MRRGRAAGARTKANRIVEVEKLFLAAHRLVPISPARPTPSQSVSLVKLSHLSLQTLLPDFSNSPIH
jgi:hypothetical protein